MLAEAEDQLNGWDLTLPKYWQNPLGDDWTFSRKDHGRGKVHVSLRGHCELFIRISQLAGAAIRNSGGFFDDNPTPSNGRYWHLTIDNNDRAVWGVAWRRLNDEGPDRDGDIAFERWR